MPLLDKDGGREGERDRLSERRRRENKYRKKRKRERREHVSSGALTGLQNQRNVAAAVCRSGRRRDDGTRAESERVKVGESASE